MARPKPADAADGWRLPVVPDWGFESEPNGAGATSRLRRGRVVGGTSWLTRFAVRGAAADFDAWAARGNPGWSFAEVLPAFRRIEADAEFGDRPWHGDEGPIPITRYPGLEPSEIHAAALEAFDAVGIPRTEDHNEPGAVGAGPMPMSSRVGVRVTSADAYLADGTRPSNLVIRTEAMAASVMLESGRATAVQLDDGTLIRADLIVLAAGTYGSPAILMRSGIGPAAHLAPGRRARHWLARPGEGRPDPAHDRHVPKLERAERRSTGLDVLDHRPRGPGARLLVRSGPAHAPLTGLGQAPIGRPGGRAAHQAAGSQRGA